MKDKIEKARPAPVANVPEAGPRNRRELAEAIFAACDPVALGIELLQSGNERSSAVKARVWETLVEYQFGKPAASSAEPARAGVRIIWNIPGPAYESAACERGSITSGDKHNDEDQTES